MNTRACLAASMRTKVATLAVLLILSFNLTAQADVRSDEIQALITEGKLRQALSLTDKQLLKDGGNVTFRFLKGLILTRLNELDKARELFIALTREHPDLPEPYNNLAVIYASQGDFEKARESLQKAISTHPSYATAHENMGDIYAKMASKAYNQALQLDSDNASAKAKLSLINDLFFVPKSAMDKVETVARAETAEAESVDEPQIAEPAPAVITEPAPQTPEPVKQEDSETAGRELIAAQQKAKKEQEDKKREQEKIKGSIAESIDSWASAWSAKDAAKYITFYGPEFTPPKKLTRSAWEAQRKVRLAKPRFIRIGVSNMKISLLGDNHAKAEFRQKYESDTYKDEVNKSMILKKINDRWYITQEQSK